MRTDELKSEKYIPVGINAGGITKTLISCAVTAQLICVFGFAYADSWFSDAADQICELSLIFSKIKLSRIILLHLLLNTCIFYKQITITD